MPTSPEGVMDVTYDEGKFAEVLLYVAERLGEDPAGGATKLNKALFFAEFAHMRATGRPITGAEYQKLPYGPAPRPLVPVRDRLIAEGAAAVREEVYLGRVQKRLVALRPADVSRLEASEIAILDQVLDGLRGQTGTAVSETSHLEPGWQMVEENETIPYEAAFLRTPVVTSAVRDRVSALAAKHLP